MLSRIAMAGQVPSRRGACDQLRRPSTIRHKHATRSYAENLHLAPPSRRPDLACTADGRGGSGDGGYARAGDAGAHHDRGRDPTGRCRAAQPPHSRCARLDVAGFARAATEPGNGRARRAVERPSAAWRLTWGFPACGARSNARSHHLRLLTHTAACPLPVNDGPSFNTIACELPPMPTLYAIIFALADESPAATGSSARYASALSSNSSIPSASSGFAK